MFTRQSMRKLPKWRLNRVHLPILFPTKLLSPLACFFQLTLLLGLALAIASGQAQTPNTPQTPALHLRNVGGLAGLHQYTRNEEPFWSRELARLSKGKYSTEIVPSEH